jgi:hypothetical protein
VPGQLPYQITDRKVVGIAGKRTAEERKREVERVARETDRE